ncbi:MAG: hypothetical protein WA414_04950 [Acidobacteriaceae bacterium]
MTGGPYEFNELMMAAHRVIVALDGMTRRDGSGAASGPVGQGKHVYKQLLAYRFTDRMTRPEAHALDSAVDLLKTRLKFFGESL